MQRDKLFGFICGMLAAKGRDRTLFGGRIDTARQAFCGMAPKGNLAHAYFETPLLGPPTLDVHCSLGHDMSAWPLDEGADDVWQAALAWFSKAGPFQTRADEVLLMAEADTGTGHASLSGMYLIQRERADLVEPFLTAMEKADKFDAWQHFVRRLPQGWDTTYVGFFSGRSDDLLRVNAHPTAADAASLEEAWQSLGLTYDNDVIGLCRDLLAYTQGLDVQLDVDEEGHPQGAFGLEFYIEDTAAEPLLGNGSGARAIAHLESLGLADDRWHQAAEACLSRRISMPSDRGTESIAVSVRPFSVKLKILGGKPLPAKLYLRGDAGTLDPR